MSEINQNLNKSIVDFIYKNIENPFQDKYKQILYYYIISSFLIYKQIKNVRYSLKETMQKKLSKINSENIIIETLNALSIKDIENVFNIALSKINNELNNLIGKLNIEGIDFQGISLNNINLFELISSFRYIFILENDLFYLEYHYFFVKDYFNVKFRSKSEFLYEIENNEIKEYYNKFNSALLKLDKLLENLKESRENSYKKSYILSDRVILSSDHFKKIYNLNPNTTKIEIENIIEFLIDLYNNTIKYLGVKTKSLQKFVEITINNFILDSSVENFIYMLLFFVCIKKSVDTNSTEETKIKKIDILIKKIKRMIDDNLFFVGYLEEFKTINFQEYYSIVNKKALQKTLF
jgi:hypothetical protein